MTLIEIRPHGRGWKVFEASGVEPIFLEKNQAINYAQNRASFRSLAGQRRSAGNKCRVTVTSPKSLSRAKSYGGA
jgi:hypothetical protein